MITIVYLENPFKPQNRVIRQISAAEAPAVIDVAALLNANLSGEMILSVNGQKVAADHLLKDGDFVVIAPNVLGGGGSGKNIAGIVAGIALMAFSGGAGAGLLGILGTTQGSLGLGLALYSGGSLLMGNQRLPKIDTPNVQSSFENGYGWSPNQVRLQPGSPLPITYGTFKTSGQLIARRVYPGNFAGKQTQYLSMLLAAGEGPIDMITDIEINDTPIASIQGATSDYRLGTNNQTEIPGISNIIEDQVFSSELPLSGSAWITKTQPEPGDRVTHTFVFPAGLYAVDTRSGATIPCRGAIRWQYREVGASSWIPLLSHYYFGQTRRPLYFILDFSPPDKTKTYEFRAQNYTLERYREIEGGDWVGLTEMPGNYSAAINWIGLTVKSWKNQAYPGTALVYINLPATENLSGSMPRVSWKQIRATVNVWNPTEERYQAKDATNIAWMVYDLLHQCKLLKNIQTGLDEYVVFGEPKENLNYTEFAAWASFCAETAGGAPRGKGNALIDSPEQIWPIVQKVATSGRGFIVQQAGVFKPVWDSTRTMSQIFTAGNIIDGSLSGSFLPERERASALEVSFFDEDNGYERTTLFVPGDDYNPAGLENPSQIFLPCITSSKVAYMWAKHQLKKNKHLKRTATLQADIDSIVAELGDVVGIQSDVTSWGVGGRILGATATSVVIDQAVTLAPGITYSLLIRYPDNTLVRRVVDAVLVSTTTTTLNFTGAPWPTAPERFCVYSFGINTLETKPFQITDIRRNGDLQATLELLEYIEDVYTEATDFPVIDYTAASAGISSLTVKADSDTGKLGIAWTIPTDRDYAGSIVYVDGKPQGFFPVDVTDLDIDATPGSHTVTVRPVDGSGNYGTEAEEEVTLGDPALSSVSSPSLSSIIRGQADGTDLVYITGTFTIPDLASSVLVEIGEGSNPVSWATVQDSRVDAVLYGPVSPGTLYTLRLTAKNRYAVATPILGSITTAVDTTAPSVPVIAAAVKQFKIITLEISLSSPPSDLAGFLVYRNTTNNSAGATVIGAVPSKSGQSAVYTDVAPNYGTKYFYFAKAFDTWENRSDFSAVASATTEQIVSEDLAATAMQMPTGALLSLSAKNCTTTSIAEVNGVKDVSGNGNHGQAFGGVEVVDSEMGKAFRQSRYRHIQCSGAELTATDRTFSCWIRKINETNTWSQILAQNTAYNYGVDKNLTGLWMNSIGAIRACVGNGVSYRNVHGLVPTPNRFYHVACVIEGNVALKLYIDGILANSVTLSFAPPTDGLSVFIGGYSSTPEFDCFDPRVYNRALSPSEIKTLYMFPDDAAFGQLTADLIGANVIKAKNLIQSEAVIANKAQINSGVFNEILVKDSSYTSTASTASTAMTTANTANSTASAAQTTANTAKTAVDNWAVAGTNYTQIKGGVITTGQIKSDDYVPPAVGESFAQSGSSYDLDNATITTENFYSNENGAGIKGYIEADTGKIGRWNISPAGRLYVNVENFYESDPALEITANVSVEAEDMRALKKVFLGWIGEDAGLLLSQEQSILSTGVLQDTWYTTIRPGYVTSKSNDYSTNIGPRGIRTTNLASQSFIDAGDKGPGLKVTVFEPNSPVSGLNQEGTLGVKTLTLAGDTSATVTIDSDNPKIVFESADRTEKAALVFTDADSYAAPASVSLVGNQGNEVFIAPRFRANAPTGPASVLLSGGNNSNGEAAIFGLTYSGASPMIGYGVKPHPSAHGQFVSSYGANLGRIALLLDGNGFRVFTGGTVNAPIGNAVSMTDRFKIDHSGNLTLNGYATEQSRLQNGYLKFNGIIIQWGRVYWNGTGWFAVTFPTAFSSATSWGLANTASKSYINGCDNFSSTGCIMHSGADNNYINWVAIGY